MPYRRRSKTARRKYGKKAYGRRPNKVKRMWMKRRNATVVPQVGVADATYVKIRYCERFTFGTNGPTPYSLQYRGNSPYDPYFTGGGGSPGFFGRYADLYKYYRCYGSKIKVSFMQNGSAAIPAGHQICAVYPALPDETIPAQAVIVLERRRCRYNIVSPSDNSVKTIKHYARTNTIYGVDKKVVDSDDQFQSLSTGGPANQWYWNVINQTQDETTATAASCIVWLTYYCKFYGAKVLQNA